MNTKQLSNEGRQIKHEKGGKKTRKLADREVEGGGRGSMGEREVCHSLRGEGGWWCGGWWWWWWCKYYLRRNRSKQHEASPGHIARVAM